LVVAADCCAPAELAGTAPTTPQPAAAAPPQDGAERRHLTMMFCDLVGSTPLSARLDPEDLRGIIGAYHRCSTELVKRNGGFVAKYMGDGMLAYFGYPAAHEHDAERAVRGGLALVEAVPKLVTAAGSPLQVRVGIATGLVVVGDLIGSGESQERGIVGETPNLAARPGDRRAEYSRHRRQHATTSRQSFRAHGPRGQRPQRHRRARAGLGGAADEFRGEPLRGAAHDQSDCTRRAGRRIRIAPSALVQGKDGRRPSRAALRRAGDIPHRNSKLK
jgi:hypothetical protein